jgi:hypothetical protein
MTTLLFLGIANGMISLCLAKAELFRTPREFLFNRSIKLIYNFLYNLISCPYCLSHWVAAAMVIIWKPVITHCGICLFDYVISVFVMVGFATITWTITFGLMNWADGEVEK